MKKHGEIIYRGKLRPDNKNPITVYLCGTWILLVDSVKNRVITLYKIDFYVGDDFNKLYIQRVLERMKEHEKALQEKTDQIATQRNDYINIIKGNEEQINEYRSAIKKLEKLNADYKEIVDTMDAERQYYELAIRHDIEDLTGNVVYRSDRDQGTNERKYN